jgi:hypothetical protein
MKLKLMVEGKMTAYCPSEIYKGFYGSAQFSRNPQA